MSSDIFTNMKINFYTDANTLAFLKTLIESENPLFSKYISTFIDKPNVFDVIEHMFHERAKFVEDCLWKVISEITNLSDINNLIDYYVSTVQQISMKNTFYFPGFLKKIIRRYQKDVCSRTDIRLDKLGIPSFMIYNIYSSSEFLETISNYTPSPKAMFTDFINTIFPEIIRTINDSSTLRFITRNSLDLNYSAPENEASWNCMKYSNKNTIEWAYPPDYKFDFFEFFASFLNPDMRVTTFVLSRSDFKPDDVSFDSYKTYGYLVKKDIKFTLKRLKLLKDHPCYIQVYCLVLRIALYFILEKDIFNPLLEKVDFDIADKSIIRGIILYGSDANFDKFKKQGLNNDIMNRILECNIDKAIRYVNYLSENTDVSKIILEYFTRYINFDSQLNKLAVLTKRFPIKSNLFGNFIISNLLQVNILPVPTEQNLASFTRFYTIKTIFRKLVRRYVLKNKNIHRVKSEDIRNQITLMPDFMRTSFVGNDYAKIATSKISLPISMTNVDLASLWGQTVLITPKANGVPVVKEINGYRVHCEQIGNEYYIYDVDTTSFLELREKLSLIDNLPSGYHFKEIVEKTINEDTLRMLDTPPSTPYSNDGYIIYAGPKTFKLKPKEHLTIDLKFIDGKWVSREGKVYDIEGNSNILNNEVWRCYYNEKECKWFATDYRFEKREANPTEVVDIIIDTRFNYKVPSSIISSRPYYEECSYLANISKYENSTKTYELLSNNISSTDRILDIGAGYGSVWKYVFANVYAIDIDPFCMSYCRKIVPNYLCMDINKPSRKFLEWIQEPFDVVVLNFTVQYITTDILKCIHTKKMIIQFTDNDCKYVIGKKDSMIGFSLPWKKKIHWEPECSYDIILDKIHKPVSVHYEKNDTTNIIIINF